MKKNLLYLLALVCCINFFAACSDDDDDNKPPTTTDPEWTDYVATYSTDNVLILNKNKNENEDVKAVLAKGTDSSAKLTLENIVIGASSLVIDGIEMEEGTNGTYTFDKTQTEGESTVNVKGTLTPGVITKEALTQKEPATLDITVTREITSDIVGEWKLDLATGTAFNLNATLSEDASAEIQGAWAGLESNLVLTVNNMLAGKVEAVTINFQKNGVFTFNWLPVGATDPLTVADIENQIIAGVMGSLVFEYYTKDNVVFIGIPKDILDEVEELASLPQVQPYLPIITLATNLFNENGNYALLALNMIEEEDATAFSLTLPGAVAVAMQSFLEPLIPEGMISEDMLGMVLAEIDEFDVMLNFNK